VDGRDQSELVAADIENDATAHSIRVWKRCTNVDELFPIGLFDDLEPASQRRVLSSPVFGAVSSKLFGALHA
jgi:hypothetical protein